jgi:hypothetical protein
MNKGVCQEFFSHFGSFFVRHFSQTLREKFVQGVYCAKFGAVGPLARRPKE